MNDHTCFCVGDKLQQGPADRYVEARWWSCKLGTVIYRVGDGKENGKSWILGQEELVERMKKQEGGRVEGRPPVLALLLR